MNATSFSRREYASQSGRMNTALALSCRKREFPLDTISRGARGGA